MKEPLVSVIMPAYNAQKWIAESIRSFLGQTWPRKELIVVDDGSTDQTVEVARQFQSKNVVVIRTENQGAAAARNTAYKISQGDYLQWLDADDLLAPDKIERQLAALRERDSKRLLLSSAWGHFYYRTRYARFAPNVLWQDLSPVEFLLGKMRYNLHMQGSNWLTSRELIEAAGLWDTRLHVDDDGEYYCRILLASEGIRFVPESKVFYRMTQWRRMTHIGASDKKKDAMLLSMKLHVKSLRSLEESERVREACLAYLQNWYDNFYPERPDLVVQLRSLAAELGGRLEAPRLRWKYRWIKPLLGWKAGKWSQTVLPEIKGACIRRWDKAMYDRETAATPAPDAGDGGSQEALTEAR